VIPNLLFCSAVFPSASDAFRLLCETVRDAALFFVSPEWVIVAWSDSARRLTGYRSEEVLGRSAIQRFALADALTNPPESGISHSQQSIGRRDGSLFWGQVTCRALLQGDLLSGYAVVLRDLAAHQEQEQFTQRLFQHCGDLVTVTAMSSRRLCFACSPMLQRFGYTFEEFDQLPKPQLFHPEDYSGVEEAVQQALEEGSDAVTHKHRMKHKDGSYRWMNATFSREKRRDELLLIVNAQDITDRVRLEHNVQQLTHLATAGRLLAGVTHDFKNLLTVVQGNADMLELELQGDDSARTLVNSIQGATQKATSLCQTLLTQSQPRRKAQERCDLTEAVYSVLDLLRHQLMGYNVQVTLASDLNEVALAATSVVQILMNLLLNARDATAEGGQIAVSTQRVEKAGVAMGCLRISDTGTGMSEETQARVFEMYFSTKPPEQGSGIGLAIVQESITKAGGTIELESQLGVGTTFCVCLPLV
jgi:hypothetical protein